VSFPSTVDPLAYSQVQPPNFLPLLLETSERPTALNSASSVWYALKCTRPTSCLSLNLESKKLQNKIHKLPKLKKKELKRYKSRRILLVFNHWNKSMWCDCNVRLFIAMESVRVSFWSFFWIIQHPWNSAEKE